MRSSFTTPFGIIIYDDEEDRRESLYGTCRSIFPDKDVETEPYVYDDQSQGLPLRNLPENTKLVFLHLGKDPEEESDDRWGNIRSEEFWNQKLKGQKGITVIAYTAGAKSEEGGQYGKPNSFPEDKWHTYLYGIGDATRLNLALFFRKWSENVEGSPPLHLLQEWPPLPQAFDILRVGFLAAFGGTGVEGFSNLPNGLRNRVRSMENQERVSNPDWWKPVLGEDLKGKALSQETPDRIRKKMVRQLVALLGGRKKPTPKMICGVLNPEYRSKADKS